MTLESKAAFARRLGVNKSTITRAAQAGRLVLQDGLVDVEASMNRWNATQGGRSDVSARHAAQRGQCVMSAASGDPGMGSQDAATAQVAGQLPLQPAAQPTGPSAGVIDDGAARTHYKALALRFANEAIELEMALRRHQRYPLETVRREAQALGMMLRASMERLIDQTAPRLAATDDAAAREALLRAECGALAAALRVEFRQALRRLRTHGGKV